MKHQTIIGIVFFVAAILTMFTSITASVNGQPTNWMLLVGGICFLIAGIVWFVQGLRTNSKNKN